MTKLQALREVPSDSVFRKGDYFVVFGELFGRGYANGLVRRAAEAGMNIVGMTVGRRVKGVLRPLDADEIAEAERNLGGKIINVPLEAGFDLEVPDGAEHSTVDLLSGLKLNDWESFSFDDDFVEACRKKGVERFVAGVRKVMEELSSMIPSGAGVFFAHTMAGGFPRAKILFALANRIFKGRGDRHMHSGRFWQHSIGRCVAKNFVEVTAETFRHLIEESASLRSFVESAGGKVFYSAYGYHGTEILIDDEYRWQTYTPYQQGHAKKELEKIAAESRRKGIHATVFNCPEIRTNSSDIFMGVELSLFPLLSALGKESRNKNSAWIDAVKEVCRAKLKPEFALEAILEEIQSYLKSEVLTAYFDFENWPLENSPELSELMVGTSENIVTKHLSSKDLISDYLSLLVVESVGSIIFNGIGYASESRLWLGHDVVAKQLLESPPAT